jgi:hypothetical protein
VRRFARERDRDFETAARRENGVRKIARRYFGRAFTKRRSVGAFGAVGFDGEYGKLVIGDTITTTTCTCIYILRATDYFYSDHRENAPDRDVADVFEQKTPPAEIELNTPR